MPITRQWSGKLQPPEPPPVLVYFVTRSEELGRLVQQRLAPLELQVHPFNAGSHLMQTVRRVPPHLVLIEDTRKEDVLGLATQVRQALGPPAGIILICRTVSQEKVLQAVKAGVTRIVVYPFTLPGLLTQIVACCGRMGVKLDVSQALSSDDAPVLEGRAALLERLSQVHTVNSLPHVIARVTELTGGSEGSAADLEQVIGADASSTAVLIKRANAPVYAAVRRITRLRDCIARIGFDEVRSIVLALALMELISTEQKTLGFDRLEFWKSSLATALLAREIAERSGVVRPEQAFLCGLLADFGKLILDEHLTQRFEAAICKAQEEHLHLRDAARAVMNLDHLDVGALLLEKWRFPAPLVAAVRAHEDVERIEYLQGEAWGLAGCVCLGKWVALALGIGDGGDPLLDVGPATLLDQIEAGGLLEPLKLAPLVDELNDLLIPFRVRVRSPFAEGERPTIRFFDLDPQPVSLVELLILRAGGRPRRLAEAELVRLGHDQHLVVQAASAARLLAEARRRGWDERPVMLLAPPPAEPTEGWPLVGRCQTIEFPLDVRRTSQALLDLAQKSP